jgi:hypothetical protein
VRLGIVSLFERLRGKKTVARLADATAHLHRARWVSAALSNDGRSVGLG